MDKMFLDAERAEELTRRVFDAFRPAEGPDKEEKESFMKIIVPYVVATLVEYEIMQAEYRES